MEYGPSIESGTRPHMPPVSELVIGRESVGLTCTRSLKDGIAGTKAPAVPAAGSR